MLFLSFQGGLTVICIFLYHSKRGCRGGGRENWSSRQSCAEKSDVNLAVTMNGVNQKFSFVGN